MIGIIGGGFGLYGWLPAIAIHYPNEKILIESRHKEKFDSRPELQQFASRIDWMDYVKDIPYLSRILILAIPPESTEYYLNGILASNSIEKLIVEKPICETPEKSKEFIDKVKSKGIDIVSPFLFIFTDWFADLKYYLHSKDKNEVVSIDWFFKAYHFKFEKDNWKRYHKQGGGPLRFYGIHLLAVLAELGYLPSRQILDENRYFGVFKQKNYPDVILRINTNSDEILFKIDELVYKMTPFESSINGDSRIPNIINMLKTMDFRIGMVEDITKRTINLWKQVEEQI